MEESRQTSAIDALESVRQSYRERGIGNRIGFGRSCAVIVVDFQRAYTRTWRAPSLDPVHATSRLLDVARNLGVPVIYTYQGYDPEKPDAGVWGIKAPTLLANTRGSEDCEIDPLISPHPEDLVIEKRAPSAFFNSGLADHLRGHGIDTVVVVGATTSGCVRATVVDGLSHDFRVIVPSECVLDPSIPSAETALMDIDIKYGDVVSLTEAIEGMKSASSQVGAAREGRT